MESQYMLPLFLILQIKSLLTFCTLQLKEEDKKSLLKGIEEGVKNERTVQRP